MYELKKLEKYLRVNLLGPGPSSYKKRIYRAAVSQRLRNTVLYDGYTVIPGLLITHFHPAPSLKKELSYTSHPGPSRPLLG
jgi:hypothetical protein